MSQTTEGTPAAAHDAGLSVGGNGDNGGSDGEPRILTSDEDIAAALGDDRSGDDNDGIDGSEADEGGLSGDGQDGRQAADAPPVVDAPATWTAEEKKLFAQMPPALQQAVSRREVEREQFVNARARETQEARQQRDHVSQWAASQLGPAVQAAQTAMEYEFAGIDWINLQKTDPAAFLQLDAMRRERTAAVEKAMGAYNQFMGQQKAMRQQQHKQHVAEHMNREFGQALPAVQALIGQGFEGKKFSADLSEYLKSVGAPEDHIKGIDFGYQLVLATKAMLYDKMQKTAQNAAQKVANAPQVQGVKGRQFGKGEGNPQAARDILRKNGSSTENVADALKHLGF
jgi:hypothetical protein